MISSMGLGGNSESLGAALASRLNEDPILRADVARFDVDAIAFRALSEQSIDQLRAGKSHPAQSSVLKYAGTELNKARHELIMAAGGSAALEWESERSRRGKAAREWLRSKANSIEGGTSEIQLGIIARHMLGLPGA
jgi:alkylation response protein AidB-like acyl-CoA dehydrogenase